MIHSYVNIRLSTVHRFIFRIKLLRSFEKLFDLDNVVTENVLHITGTVRLNNTLIKLVLF